MKPITAVLTEVADQTVAALSACQLVEGVVLLVPPGTACNRARLGDLPCREIETPEPTGGDVVSELFETAKSHLLLEVQGDFDPHPTALARMVTTATESGAAMVFGDYADASPAGPIAHPLSDCQPGSLEDGFPLGPLRLWSVASARDALAVVRGLRWMGWYALRLAAARPIVHLPEVLGVLNRSDRRKSGEKQFDYLIAARERQIEAEEVVTTHLKRIGAFLPGPFADFVPTGHWPVEGTVIIPIRNRSKTVRDAVMSALSQRTAFPFNVIVVDNHSTDGTTELLRREAKADPRLVHIVPIRTDLGIGGCWNVGVLHPLCGKYVVQLDSDDLYAGPGTLQRMVALLTEEKCGMAVGSYTLVNMDLQVLPPGLIDHREWTANNGPNNALRISGFGAPRAMATELVRAAPFPNVSYGEDYATALRICRTYRVGRIYDSLYLCRRWEENSDADLSATTKARYQAYKDRIRTLEIEGRRRGNHRS